MGDTRSLDNGSYGGAQGPNGVIQSLSIGMKVGFL